VRGWRQSPSYQNWQRTPPEEVTRRNPQDSGQQPLFNQGYGRGLRPPFKGQCYGCGAFGHIRSQCTWVRPGYIQQ
jgi:hypothetical protein